MSPAKRLLLLGPAAAFCGKVASGTAGIGATGAGGNCHRSDELAPRQRKIFMGLEKKLSNQHAPKFQAGAHDAGEQ